ncbi:hypothetical protein [Fimbriiglobus ruber]|uniref:hypothetical protein n=1 Tax=Fimbriiglobus ruber TaxID=1908690 RepID=UPI000B4AEB16|nr:hypothetical protein [Fimbriiglobus ruber]
MLSLLLIALACSMALGGEILSLSDPIDDEWLVGAVSGQPPVKEFGSAIHELIRPVCALKQFQIEKVLGRPTPKKVKDYAMPIGQSRMWSLSGIRYVDEKMNKDHTKFYPIDDIAGIEVWYGIDGESPQFALLYFKIDETFPKLKKVEEKHSDQPVKKVERPTALRKNGIDSEHWSMMKTGVNKEEIEKLFLVPAGNYAPGTEYLTRSWGIRRAGYGKVQETLEWRGEKGYIVVEFDEKGILLNSECFLPGRDPVTNVAERLKWDRSKFEKVKKYVEGRMAAK